MDSPARSGALAQASHLFTTTDPGDAHKIGDVEFERNLAIRRLADAKNHVTHPTDPRIEVEDAMAVTLKKNHIDLPDSFYTVASNFHPKYPPQQKKDKKETKQKKDTKKTN
jgi:hypothetical protein